MSKTDPADVFRNEAQELLEQIEQGLLDLEQSPSDSELVAHVFRALHTLKGSGAMFGYDALSSFTHHCETAFDKVRKGERAATPHLISAVLGAVDHMRSLAEKRETPAGEGEKLLAVVTDALESATAAPQAAPQHRWHIRFKLPPDALVNGTRPLSLLDELRGLGDCEVKALTDALPPLAELNPRECHLAWDVVLTTDKPRSEIEDVFIFVIDDMMLEIEDLATQNDSSAAEAAVPAKGESRAAAENAVSDGKAALPGGTLRVPAERLDDLMDRVGELVIVQSRLREVSATIKDVNLVAVTEEIARLSAELRDSMMFVRMVPISQLFARFRRLVHDLARDLGKSIDLVVEGETTELDKTVIERLADPLVHLIRNAVDHGLESPADRVKAGKPETGKITLTARQAGAEVVITVGDDGRGINRAKVRTKAEELGFLAPGAPVSDQELLNFLFEAGFSTAGNVTKLSGRGVGMDVVKRTLEGLRGSIEMKSEEGVGSQVMLRIPLTLAIIDGLLVKVGDGRYVIPLSSVEECVEFTREQDLRSTGRSFLSLRNQLVPFLRLRELFSTQSAPGLYQKAVVVTTGLERVGLIVDHILGQHQTVIKPLPPLHANVEGFSGATILGDGTVALILDVGHLVTLGGQIEDRRKAG